MRRDVVEEGEDLRALSMRLDVPACMLMRANRIFSPAWLLPGREVFVPEGDFCKEDDGACPVKAFSRPARSSPEERILDTLDTATRGTRGEDPPLG